MCQNPKIRLALNSATNAHPPVISYYESPKADGKDFQAHCCNVSTNLTVLWTLPLTQPPMAGSLNPVAEVAIKKDS